MKDDHTAAIRSNPKDKAAWDDWFRAVYPRVYYSLYRRTGGDATLSEEATQGALERFLRYRAHRKVSSDKDAVAYLIRTGLRLLDDEHKQRQRQQDLALTGGGSPTQPGGGSTTDRLDMERLLEGLSTVDQELMGLVLEGRSVAEIAEILEIGFSTAGMRIQRAKARLKKNAREE